jgi:hypothetical protein
MATFDEDFSLMTYELVNLVTCGGTSGCVESVFRHDPTRAKV